MCVSVCVSAVVQPFGANSCDEIEFASRAVVSSCSLFLLPLLASAQFRVELAGPIFQMCECSCTVVFLQFRPILLKQQQQKQHYYSETWKQGRGDGANIACKSIIAIIVMALRC